MITDKAYFLVFVQQNYCKNRDFGKQEVKSVHKYIYETRRLFQYMYTYIYAHAIT